VTNRTRQRDFLRAGLVREEVVRDEHGDIVMIGTGRHEWPKTRIVTRDDDGREIDLHALRATLGTTMARQGVPPRLAQQVMRHASYRTTEKHDVVLGLDDASKAMDAVPAIQTPDTNACRATGTTEATPMDGGDSERQRYPRQLERETVRNDATARNGTADNVLTWSIREHRENKGANALNSVSDKSGRQDSNLRPVAAATALSGVGFFESPVGWHTHQHGTMTCRSRGDRIRTCGLLLPKQALYQAELRPARRPVYAHPPAGIIPD